MPNEYTFDVKTVSALFMHGADNRQQAELRISSFEGLIRYWFRAVVGPYVSQNHRENDPDENCRCLHCLEGKVFGSADFGKGISYRFSSEKIHTEPSKKLLPHRAPKDKPSPSPSIRSDSVFQFKIRKALPTTTDAALLAATGAFWLAVHLGGFGQRARRGAGSVCLTGIAPEISGMPPVGCVFKNINELGEYLTYGVWWARNLILHCLNLDPDHMPGCSEDHRGNVQPPAFPQLCPDRPEITQMNITEINEKDEEAARAAVMRSLRPFKNPVFGLPYLRPAPHDQKEPGRHASPLWIHLVRLKTGHFAAVRTVMKSATLIGHEERLDAYMNRGKDCSVAITDETVEIPSVRPEVPPPIMQHEKSESTAQPNRPTHSRPKPAITEQTVVWRRAFLKYDPGQRKIIATHQKTRKKTAPADKTLADDLPENLKNKLFNKRKAITVDIRVSTVGHAARIVEIISEERKE